MPEIKSKENFTAEFAGALSTLSDVENEGMKASRDGFKKLFFVGCGAPFQMMKSVNFWADRFCSEINVRTYHAGEFVHLDPAALDEQTIVLLVSHSGTTQEVVSAAEILKGKPCKTFAFTQKADSPLASVVDHVFAYGETNQGYFSSLVLTLAFTSGLLSSKEQRWPERLDLINSLKSLPGALADAKFQAFEKGRDAANKLKGEGFVYFIGSGPMFTTAYIFAACFLMEMQWMHAFPLSAAEFFHGPFEVFDHETPVVLMLGEDPSRPEAERVLAFCREHLSEPIIYDARDFEMPGISRGIRPLLAPFILDSAMTNLVEQLAVLNDHPLTTRRYMGKVAY
jgi:fructoselysine 6-phosphate deglycase